MILRAVTPPALLPHTARNLLALFCSSSLRWRRFTCHMLWEVFCLRSPAVLHLRQSPCRGYRCGPCRCRAPGTLPRTRIWNVPLSRRMGGATGYAGGPAARALPVPRASCHDLCLQPASGRGRATTVPEPTGELYASLCPVLPTWWGLVTGRDDARSSIPQGILPMASTDYHAFPSPTCNLHCHWVTLRLFGTVTASTAYYTMRRG